MRCSERGNVLHHRLEQECLAQLARHPKLLHTLGVPGRVFGKGGVTGMQS